MLCYNSKGSTTTATATAACFTQMRPLYMCVCPYIGRNLIFMQITTWNMFGQLGRILIAGLESLRRWHCGRRCLYQIWKVICFNVQLGFRQQVIWFMPKYMLKKNWKNHVKVYVLQVWGWVVVFIDLKLRFVSYICLLDTFAYNCCILWQNFAKKYAVCLFLNFIHFVLIILST